LHSHGVGTARAVRIFKTYGADAIQVMTENPYRLARDIRGIGFKTADAIAMKLGIEKTAMVRVRAGISYALTKAMDEGHCGLPTEELTPLAEKLLEVPEGLIRTALDLELQEGTVVADRVGEIPCVFLAGLHRAERTIAERLMRQANGTLPWPWIDPDKALPWVEERIGLALAESQVAAIRLALMSKVLVMTGGPGVGKTTIVKAILRILSAKGVRLLLCAPTGRAAKRMTEATGFEAKTIHRLLEVDPKSGGFKRGDDNPLDCNLLVVDETSMVDVMLMQALMKAVPEKAALLIVGDIDQLPSVGPGQVLADIISSGAGGAAARRRLPLAFHHPARGRRPGCQQDCVSDRAGACVDADWAHADTLNVNANGTITQPNCRGRQRKTKSNSQLTHQANADCDSRSPVNSAVRLRTAICIPRTGRVAVAAQSPWRHDCRMGSDRTRSTPPDLLYAAC
jgi:exodeoxyribonuclease V alpha subunit